MGAKVYNSLNSSGSMVEKAENVIFLNDEDIQILLRKGKIQTNGITVAHLQGSLISKKDIVSVGKPGYYHILVATLGNEFSSAFVVPADLTSNASDRKEEGK